MVRVNSAAQKLDRFFPALSKHTTDADDTDISKNIQETRNTAQIEIDSTNNQNDQQNNEVANNIEDNVLKNHANGNKEDNQNNDNIINKNNVREANKENEKEIEATDTEMEEKDNSLIQEPKETNKIQDKWKLHAADQANITFIDPKESFKTRKFQYERIETKLTSVKQLRLDVENRCNMNLREVLANLIFIACIDSYRSLIQHSTRLYLCDTTRLT